MAGRCSTVLVEQPSAISRHSALRNAFSVMILSGVRPSSTICTMRMPVFLARRIRALSTAAMVPFPGSAIPMTSVMQFMELAVNMPEQEPQPGQALDSTSLSPWSSILPALYAPTASKTEFRSRSPLPPGIRPGIMGPPETTMAGRFRRRAAINMPGTILSQLGIKTMPSKPWAMAMDSQLSAISSRLAREYFMPTWPMAMPSHTPIAGNSTGTPPAIRMPSFTACAMFFR